MRPFAYTHRDTPIHTVDPRLKLLVLAAFSLAAVSLDAWAARAVLTVGLGAGLLSARIDLGATLKGARLFVVLAAAIVLFHALDGGSLTAAGAERGARVACGFLMVVIAAELTLQTTSSSRIADVLHWALAPIPRVNAGRIALMVSLSVRHATALFEVSRRIREAARVRGLHPRKRPPTYVRALSVALLRDTVLEAEQTIEALAARGYNDARTPPRFDPGTGDLVFAAISAACLAAAAGVSVLPAL